MDEGSPTPQVPQPMRAALAPAGFTNLIPGKLIMLYWLKILMLYCEDMLELEYQLITGLMQQPGFPQQPGLLQTGLLQAGLTQAGLTQAGLMPAGLTQAGLMPAGLMQTAVVQHPGLMQQSGLAQPGMWSQGGVFLPCPLQGSSLQPRDSGGAQQGAGMCRIILQ